MNKYIKSFQRQNFKYKHKHKVIFGAFQIYRLSYALPTSPHSLVHRESRRLPFGAHLVHTKPGVLGAVCAQGQYVESMIGDAAAPYQLEAACVCVCVAATASREAKTDAQCCHAEMSPHI